MTLIRHQIDTLRLRSDAPFPSQVEDAQQAIREWRHETLVRRLDHRVGDTVPLLDIDNVEGNEE